MPKRLPKKHKSQADKERDALESIVKLLDGQEWTPDTTERIAGICRAAGFAVRDTDEADADFDQVAARQGWTDFTLVGVLREFVSKAGLDDELNSFAREIADGTVILFNASPSTKTKG